MLKVFIKVNGRYYAGESEECYKSSFSGVGTHHYGSNQLTKLKFVKEKEQAYIIEGHINLKSCLDRVMQRVRDKAIALKKIEIINIE